MRAAACAGVPALDLRTPIPPRGGLRVEPGATPEACAAVMGANLPETRAAMNRMGEYIRPQFCFTAQNPDPAGVLVSLCDGKQIRLLTLWTRPDSRNGFAAVPLLSALVSAAEAAGYAEIDASAIPDDNPASLRLALALGGRKIAAYRRYEVML